MGAFLDRTGSGGIHEAAAMLTAVCLDRTDTWAEKGIMTGGALKKHTYAVASCRVLQIVHVCDHDVRKAAMAVSMGCHGGPGRAFTFACLDGSHHNRVHSQQSLGEAFVKRLYGLNCCDVVTNSRQQVVKSPALPGLRPPPCS